MDHSQITYSGTVSEGGRKARTLGFPTINIALTEPQLTGIYAGTVAIDGVAYPAVLYADQVRGVLEAHLLDVDEDLYGKNVVMTLLYKLRDDREFPDDGSLKKAIHRDTEDARAYFSSHPVI